MKGGLTDEDVTLAGGDAVSTIVTPRTRWCEGVPLPAGAHPASVDVDERPVR
jgi:hypothetical protein